MVYAQNHFILKITFAMPKTRTAITGGEEASNSNYDFQHHPVNNGNHKTVNFGHGGGISMDILNRISGGNNATTDAAAVTVPEALKIYHQTQAWLQRKSKKRNKASRNKL